MIWNCSTTFMSGSNRWRRSAGAGISKRTEPFLSRILSLQKPTLAEWFQALTAWHGPGDFSSVAHAANAHLDLDIHNFGIQEAAEFSSARIARQLAAGPAARWHPDRSVMPRIIVNPHSVC
jgi:hypothetical protein